MKYAGLSQSQAEELLKKFGPNKLPSQEPISYLKLFIAQLTSPLVYVLIVASLVTFFLREYNDTIVILVAVVINTLLGFYQEIKAEKALFALKQMLEPHAKVIRDGKTQVIDAHDLVPGDVVILAQGARVPTDGRLIEAVNLSINEAMLTGESVPVNKSAAKRTNTGKTCVFMGTIVVSGHGRFIVEATGARSQMGKIAVQIQSVVDEKTPLQRRLTSLARSLTVLVAVISAGVFVIGIIAGNSMSEMFKTAVALAVAMIPEGMLVALTVILAIGMQRILKKKALVRRLVAAETLGSVTVIATDKTGTLTEGVMKVSKSELVNKVQAYKTAVLANNLEDPLEVALWEWAKKNGIDGQKLADSTTRDGEKPFSSERMYMSVNIDGKTYIKGAPDVVLDMCRLSKEKKTEWEARIEKWSAQGLRLIGLAVGNTWLGLVGIEDPVRSGIHEVFRKTSRAGIRVIMITGDYSGTALAVWQKIEERKAIIIDGAQLKRLSDTQLESRIEKIDIFARVSPSDKLRIITALQKQGQVVALVGDGVNDAPAIKQADIGIVVGDATDVAKETADMVLLDSNFKTIVDAIEEGRGIFDNIKKVVMYLLSDAFSAVIIIVGSVILGVPLALTAAQILWINLLSDGFPDVALTVEPKERDLLRRAPLNTNVPIVDTLMKSLIAIIGVFTGITSLAVFVYYLSFSSLEFARTVAFATLGVNSLIYVFSIRSLTRPVWEVNQLKNPYLIVAVMAGFGLQLLSIYHPFFNQFLSTTPLGASEWVIVIALAVMVILLVETTKFIFKSSLKKAQTQF